MHPDAAAARDLGAGDVVSVFDDRGACPVGVVVEPARSSGTGFDVCAR
ncbi:anaerobic selenocysteine-containing dehydrogenase [Rhodococcus sp. 27YEA15]